MKMISGNELIGSTELSLAPHLLHEATHNRFVLRNHGALYLDSSSKGLTDQAIGEPSTRTLMPRSALVPR